MMNREFPLRKDNRFFYKEFYNDILLDDQLSRTLDCFTENSLQSKLNLLISERSFYNLDIILTNELNS